MDDLDFPIETINKFLKKHLFEVNFSPTNMDDYNLTTNVKVVITGVANYISVGKLKPHVEYTLYILPSNERSDSWASLFSSYYGNELELTTTNRNPYYSITRKVDEMLSRFLKYFNYDVGTMCLKIVNEVTPLKLSESIIVEGKMNNVIRTVVRDIIKIFKENKEGEFSLPEDLNSENTEYDFTQLDTTFSVYLEINQDDRVKTFETDGDYYPEDNIIYVSIVHNPNVGNEILQELTGELNEVIQHELVHIRQHEQDFDFPPEPKSPKKYYTQRHELEAQRKGFKRRSKQEKKEYEIIVRNWFAKYPHKHNLNPKQVEDVVQQIISEQ